MPLAPTLPEEVWEQIADCLTLKEWAAVCGTCKTMYSLQLKRVCMKCTAAFPEEFKWLSKRWSRACTVGFIEITSEHLRWLAREIGRSMPPRTEDATFFMDEEEDTNRLMMFMGWVLARMPLLRYFRLSVSDGQPLEWVPPLINLRHLQLGFESFTDTAVAQLQLLTNLQTLLLVSHIPSAHQPFGMLNLCPLRSLQRLCLGDMHCKKILVPQDCLVHLSSCEMEVNAQDNDEQWSDVLPCLASLHWEVPPSGGWTLGAPAPTVLTEAPNLRFVEISSYFGRIGSAKAPFKLEGALLKLTRLYLEIPKLYLQLPAGLAMEEMILVSSKRLCVSCQSIDAFVDGVRSFRFIYKKAQGSFVTDLSNAMASRGKPVAFAEDPTGRVLLEHNPAGSEFPSMDQQCPCGCCYECLLKAGLVHELQTFHGTMARHYGPHHAARREESD